MSRSALPYPGLRAFRPEEWRLFYGRDDYIDAMIERLAATRFLAVLGASGSGKSSLVHTGLIHSLEFGFFEQAGSDWKVIHCHPGSDPLRILARSLAKAGDPGADSVDAEVLRGWLASGSRAIVEWCAAGGLKPGQNLLLLVDQFEELFRFADYAAREEAEAFVALLLESAQAADLPIYVVLTMRSEYLGACALIPGLAEKMNAGFYLTPRMKRDECREAIEGPARRMKFKVEASLVNQLLNDMAAFAPWEARDGGLEQSEILSRRADQLPLMQHLLNRLWLRASAHDEAPVTLTMEQYGQVGGLAGALNDHGEEVLRSLPEHVRGSVGTVFRALVTGASPTTAVRRPCRFGDLVALTGDREIATQIVNAFRDRECTFLQPGSETPLEDGTLVDITHESLIRQWTKLEKWVTSEAFASEKWRLLTNRQQEHAQKRGELLTGLDLASTEEWWQLEKPTEAWAAGHGGRFAEIEAFVTESRRKKEGAEKYLLAVKAAEERMAAEARRRRRNWRTAAALGTLLLAFAGTTLWLHVRAKQRLAEETQSLRNQLQLSEMSRQAEQMQTKAEQVQQKQATLIAETQDTSDKTAAHLRLTKAQLDQTTVQLAQIAEERESFRAEAVKFQQELQAMQSDSQRSAEEKQKMSDENLRLGRLVASLSAPVPAPSRTTPPAPVATHGEGSQKVTVFVPAFVRSDKWVYKMNPQIYIDGHPYAFVEPGTSFSVMLPVGHHDFRVADPVVPGKAIDLSVDRNAPGFVRLDYVPKTTGRELGAYQPVQVTDSSGGLGRPISSGNILDRDQVRAQ